MQAPAESPTPLAATAAARCYSAGFPRQPWNSRHAPRSPHRHPAACRRQRRRDPAAARGPVDEAAAGGRADRRVAATAATHAAAGRVRRIPRRQRGRSVPLAGESGRPGGAAVDRGAERVHRGHAGGDAARQDAHRAGAATGDHLDHALRPDAGRRHPVLPAADPAATAAGADRAGMAGRRGEGAGGSEHQSRGHSDHRVLALAARALPRLWHGRGRQRADHDPRARRAHRQDPARYPALGRRRYHAAGPGLGCRRTRLQLCAFRAAGAGPGGGTVQCHAGPPRAGPGRHGGHRGVRQGLFENRRIRAGEFAGHGAGRGARLRWRRRTGRSIPASRRHLPARARPQRERAHGRLGVRTSVRSLVPGCAARQDRGARQGRQAHAGAGRARGRDPADRPARRRLPGGAQLGAGLVGRAVRRRRKLRAPAAAAAARHRHRRDRFRIRPRQGADQLQRLDHARTLGRVRRQAAAA